MNDLAHKIAEALEAANPNGLAYGEAERAIIQQVIDSQITVLTEPIPPNGQTISTNRHRLQCKDNTTIHSTIVVIKSSVVDDIIRVPTDEAEQLFIDTLASNLSNWDEYDTEDRNAVLENGYEKFGNGNSVCLTTE